MSKSYRIRTTPGVDKSVEIKIDQDFDTLEILSLKITQSEIYARMCADYGVVVGRVFANNGYGLPNARVSIFIPLSQVDENDPVISTLYPYKTLTDKNEDGYRYNLLPYTQSYSNHVPTGTFPSREDALTNTTIIEVYDKYYKYTAKTNDSGDFMIFGVPVGSQVLVMDLDLSDIGIFSLSPQDLIRMGIASENQINGLKFRSSTNLESLPQLININKEIEVLPFWGQPEVCQFAITRSDFDLVKEARLDIQPNAIFMGSIISSIDRDVVKRNCKPKLKSGQLCRLTTGPGEILAIRQTIFLDNLGLPILEQYELESGGKVIDDNGTWLVDLPMNMDYIYTDEFGNQVISNDPNVGIPTKAKYRFKVKWQQSSDAFQETKRGYFLVPNIREYGWSTFNQNDPYLTSQTQKSYAFSLDWNDYVDPQSAINCEDTFYEFKYNKVYTVSQLITQYRRGKFGNRFTGIKNIIDEACESENNPFPTNDANFRYDILFLLFMLLMNILKPILFVLLIVAHVLSFLLIILIPILQLIVAIVFLVISGLCYLLRGIVIAINAIPGINLTPPDCPDGDDLDKLMRQLEELKDIFTNIRLPNLSYPDCELCSCSLTVQPLNSTDVIGEVATPPPNGLLFPFQFPIRYSSHENDENEQSLWWGHMHAGMNGIRTNAIPTVGSRERTPGYFNGKWSTNRGFFTTSLPIPELINLFNLKSKYFNNDNADTTSAVINAGTFTSKGGWNQMKVTVNPTGNTATITNPFSNKFHYDKPLIVIMDNIKFNTGSILTFQDPELSKDINLTGGTFNDTFGIPTITGTVRNQLGYTIQYADPTNQYNPNPTSVTYNITQVGERIDNQNTNIVYHKFATDIEYYQVVTAMTYSDFYNQFYKDSNGDLPPYSFLGRIDGNRLIYSTSETSNCFPTGSLSNTLIVDDRPIEGVTGLENAQVHILFRGVDPYSNRQDTFVDLSRIFGYDYGSGPIVRGNFKLNWPIQPSLKLPKHDLLTDNTTNSGQAGDDTSTSNLNRIFFPSLSYDIDTTMWSGYTTNLHCFYSSCNSDWLSSTAVNTNLASSTITIGFNVGGNNVTTGADGEFRIHPNNLYCYYLPRLGGLFGTEGFYSLLNNGASGDYLYNYCNPNVNFPINSLYWGLNFFPTGGSDPNAERIYYSDSTGYQAIKPTSFSRDYGGRGKGYWTNNTKTFGEYIEGGSALVGRLMYAYGFSNTFFDTTLIGANNLNADFHSFIYGTGLTLNISNRENIVMRSERLPSSTSVEKSSLKYSTAYTYQNDYVLHQNSYFNAFEIGDDGTVKSFGATNTGGFAYQDNEDPLSGTTIDRALDSFGCGNMYPLECYSYNNFSSTIQVGPNTPNYPDCVKYRDKDIFVAGSCYNLVTTPILSLIVDFKLLTEWTSRTIINFGACRDVWSHLFVNNWINGTLYAFTFRNDVFYSGTSTSNPSMNYCKDVIIFHQDTNNFYYRSSPYNDTNNTFVGRQRPNDVPSRGPGNQKNLFYPTTILDLGPRNDYLNQLNYSTIFDGYFVDRIKSTTFGDPSELLNYFILSRMISTKFLAQLFSSQGANIFSYFTRYGKQVPRNLMVDGDYAQLISINSELGVASFEPENYPDPPPGNNAPVYYNGGDAGDAIIGVLYSSDTQIRDYVSPRRKLINPTDVVPALGDFPTTQDFYFIETKSQVVPFYKWQIQSNNDTPNIFGTQKNDWYTNPSTFFNYKYQELDRLVYPSPTLPFPEQYMMSQNTSRMDYFKGYIYGVEIGGGANADITTSPTDIFIPANNAYLVGVPYHFYFGLKQGKTAFNRFFTKWVKPEVVS